MSIRNIVGKILIFLKSLSMESDSNNESVQLQKTITLLKQNPSRDNVNSLLILLKAEFSLKLTSFFRRMAENSKLKHQAKELAEDATSHSFLSYFEQELRNLAKGKTLVCFKKDFRPYAYLLTVGKRYLIRQFKVLDPSVLKSMENYELQIALTEKSQKAHFFQDIRNMRADLTIRENFERYLKIARAEKILTRQEVAGLMSLYDRDGNINWMSEDLMITVAAAYNLKSKAKAKLQANKDYLDQLYNQNYPF